MKGRDKGIQQQIGKIGAEFNKLPNEHDKITRKVKADNAAIIAQLEKKLAPMRDEDIAKITASIDALKVLHTQPLHSRAHTAPCPHTTCSYSHPTTRVD